MRPSGKRHPRAQFVDQFPSDTILFRPKTTFRRVPSKQDFTIKRTDEAVTLIMMKGCNATLRHVSRTHHVDLCWLFDPINLDGSIFRYVRTTEQLADILTTGAFATIQWKSLMKLFDIHSPSHLMWVLTAAFSESSYSAVSQKSPLAMSNAYRSQRDFKSGL